MTGKRERDRRHDAKRREESPWRAWYGTALWQRRRQYQLRSEPLCQRCKAKGKIVPATVANHVTPHRGDWELFAAGELESLCKLCHDSDVQSEERRGYSKEIGADGFPVDPKHPANQAG